MKRFKFRIIVAAVLFGNNVLGQTTEFQGSINLRNNHRVFKVVTVPNCPQSYVPPNGANTTITHETKYTNSKTEIKVESIVDPGGSSPINILANKVNKIELAPNANGTANLYLDEKDKTILYINYWLNDKQTIPRNTLVEESTAVFDCNGSATHRSEPRRTTTGNEDYYLWRVVPGSVEASSTWFRMSDRITVYRSDGSTIDYYLVNRFDRNAKYVLELQNREAISYNSSSLDLGALTIPFKYRYGFSKKETEIKSDVTASFNIGVYAGYKLTRYSIINKSGTYTNRTSLSFRVGPFINLSSTTLDSVSTTVGKVPMKKDDKHNIAVLSTGIGLMGDIRGVQIGIYGGWDFGMGSDASNWNYHKRFWLGFGVGYKITDLFAKKE